VRDLNALYRATPALHVKDCEPDGFQWIDAADAEASLYSYIRRGGPDDAPCVVVVNMTPVERTDHAIGVPQIGHWAEIMNTDAAVYGGGNRGNLGGVDALAQAHQGQPAHIRITIPPLSTLVFRLDKG